MGNVKSVGLFLLLPAPLNPIGAFDAETFKADFRAAVAANSKAKFIGVLERFTRWMAMPKMESKLAIPL